VPRILLRSSVIRALTAAIAVAIPTRLVGLAASQFLRGVSVFRLKGLSFGEPSDDNVDLTERKRLGEIVVGGPQNAKSVHSRELQVADNQGIPGGVLLLDFLDRRATLRHRRRGVVAFSEISDEEAPDVGFVVRDPNIESSGSRLWHPDCATAGSR